MESALRVRNLVLGNQIAVRRGDVTFHHRATDGRRILRMQLPAAIAQRLRGGELAIVLSPVGVDQYVVVRREAADHLVELAPQMVVFVVTDRTGVSSEPALALHQADPEPSLRARRWRPVEPTGAVR